MGTHISKVKSVDLDSWTDEQLQSMIKWGNARANKSVYWTMLETGLTLADTGRQNWLQDTFPLKCAYAPPSSRSLF
jgi:stromal membrane-associated protein